MSLSRRLKRVFRIEVTTCRAVASPLGRPPVIITAYMSWSDKDMDTLNAVGARIAALVAAYLD